MTKQQLRELELQLGRGLVPEEKLLLRHIPSLEILKQSSHRPKEETGESPGADQ